MKERRYQEFSSYYVLLRAIRRRIHVYMVNNSEYKFGVGMGHSAR